MRNIWLHFKKVCVHRFWVFYYCLRAGIPFLGFIHDLSKFHPVEFFESVKYYRGDMSPIEACKQEKEYSAAWLYHRGHNKHHWAYWVDDFDKGMRPIRMPYKYAVEMLCDFLGAGRAYMGEDFSYLKELRWWRKEKETAVIHPDIKDFIDSAMVELTLDEKSLNRRELRELYNKNIYVS